MTQKALLQSAGDGTAVPVGYVGQLITASGSRTFAATTQSAWFVGTLSTGSGITLTAGTWDVKFSVEGNWTGGSFVSTTQILTTDTTDGTPANNTSASLTASSAFLGNMDGFSITNTTPAMRVSSGVVTLSGNQTYTIKLNGTASNFTGAINCRFIATRIA